MAISVTRPSIRRKDMDSVLTCMVSDQLGPGVRLDEFERELAKLLGGQSTVAVREYERAISLVVDALGLESGDSVVISPLAHAAYADVFFSRGIIPVFSEVDEATGNLDLAALEKRLEKLRHDATAPSAPASDAPAPDAPAADFPKALFLDSPLGAPYNDERLGELELPIVEDASHGLGARLEADVGVGNDEEDEDSGSEDAAKDGDAGNSGAAAGGPKKHRTPVAAGSEGSIGRLGRYVILSLEPESIFTTGGGAAVVSRGRNERNALSRAAESVRVNALLPDMNAALGLAQLRALDTYIERRREVSDRFRRAVMQGKHKALAAAEGSVPFAFPVLLDGAAKDVISYARKKDVEAVWAFSESIMAVADRWEACTPEHFPAASALLLRCILFPLYPTLTRADIERISKVLTTLP